MYKTIDSMKKVLEISLAGIPFTIEEDAYLLLKKYFSRFESTISNIQERKEVMEDVEARAAEIFQNEFNYLGQIVDVKLVQIVIDHLGEIDSSTSSANENQKSERTHTDFSEIREKKRFYRDPEDEKIAGVCSGIAAYFNVDVTIVRVLFLVALIAYGTTFWAYIIIWIVTKPALTVSQKLEMRGIPVTAENIKKYSTEFSQTTK